MSLDSHFFNQAPSKQPDILVDFNSMELYGKLRSSIEELIAKVNVLSDSLGRLTVAGLAMDYCSLMKTEKHEKDRRNTDS
jgi:hypothetical protein